MHNQAMSEHATWMPLKSFGLTHDFWTIQAETLVSTWIILGLILLISLYVSRCFKNEKSLVRWAVVEYVRLFKNLIQESLQSCTISQLAMIGSFFSFIVICNTIQFIPWLEEPTKDINTTFALAIISFLYVHGTSIKVNGFWQYLQHYFEPFFIMFPLHVIGNISTIISLSFRLFGNIFGGYIISSLYSSVLSGSVVLQTLGLVSGTNFSIFLFFGIAEGIIQAFVFTMLTLTYLSMNITPDDDEEPSLQTSEKRT